MSSPFFRASFFSSLFLLLLLFFFSPLLLGGYQDLKAQSGAGPIPNPGFEDTARISKDWSASYGRLVPEDSIHQAGAWSLLVSSEDGHVDLTLDLRDELEPGKYELSIWVRAKGSYREKEPFWVELWQEGDGEKLFRFGADPHRKGILSRQWVYFSEELRLDGTGPSKLFIHGDVPKLWLDGLSLEKVG